jgi:predicted permease
MSFDLILQTVVPVFLIILVGYIIGKYKKTNIQPMIDFVVYIAAPSLIFSSVSRSNINLTDFTIIALSAVAIILIMAFLVFIILKITKSDKKGLYLPMTIGNTGYIGYPVALFAFGIAGLSRAVVYDMIGSLFLFSIGIYIVHHKNEIKEAFKVPLIYAVVIGLLFSLLKIPVPDLIFKPIEMIGMITIPLALLVLGYELTKIKINSAKIAFLASLFRIIIGFVIAIAIVKIFSITGLVRNIILLQAAMPSAVMTMVLCRKYNKDAELVASIVFISTLLSIISIPLILSIL